ncbi:MAG TPA: PilZ domain-containing protein [Thermoanaerobaculia bacterium]|nr:PilZ domain-containing protein [Thermoanaerobaculia bacterium]
MELRRAPRFRGSFPVEIEPAGGVTIDMSSSGIAFETTHDYEPGDEIMLKIVVGRSGGRSNLQFGCRGRVVRVEKGESGNRVAATVEWAEDEEGPGATPTLM